jgi:hypothetical protein
MRGQLYMITRCFLASIVCSGALLGILLPGVLSAAEQPGKAPDLNGLWDGVRNTGDIGRVLGPGKIPFTPYGADRYKNIDFATNPNAQCLPPGPTRSVTGPSPFQIVQGPDVIAMLFENHFDYRIIYVDGTQHPADINEYPQFMGHSVGKWDGDKLVVDTVGINVRTWLDSNGLEHSDKLHLVETIQKTGPDRLQYSVTFEDPVFYTKPWTLTLDLKRQKKGDRLMEYVCEENEKDFKSLQPTNRLAK